MCYTGGLGTYCIHVYVDYCSIKNTCVQLHSGTTGVNSSFIFCVKSSEGYGKTVQQRGLSEPWIADLIITKVLCAGQYIFLDINMGESFQE